LTRRSEEAAETAERAGKALNKPFGSLYGLWSLRFLLIVTMWKSSALVDLVRPVRLAEMAIDLL